MRFIYIVLFGVAGVLARYYTSVIAHRWSPLIPAGTFLINILGAFLIGVVYVYGVERSQISNDLRIGIMVGFLGGFTTFSSYCLDSVHLYNQSRYLLAALYFVGSPVIGGAAVIAGIAAARCLAI